MNLRYKLFSGFILLIIIPLFLLGTMTFFITFQLIEKKYSEEAEFSMRAMGHSINYIFDEINQITDSGIMNNVFKQAMESPDEDAKRLEEIYQLYLNSNSELEQRPNGDALTTEMDSENLQYLNAEIIRNIEQQRNFRKLIYNHPSISYAFLYNFKGYGPSKVISIFAKENFEWMPYDQFKKHPLYQEVIARAGKPLWVGPNEFPELTGYDPVFTQIRLVKETSTLKDLGVSVVQMKDTDLDTFFSKFYTASEMDFTRFFIVNKQGLILYDNRKEIGGEKLSSHLSKQVTSTSRYTSFKAEFNDHESVISMYDIPDYDWQLVSVRNWNSLSKEMLVFVKWVSVIMIGCVIGAVLFILLFMNRITNNITRIVRFMRKVEDGDFNARVSENGNDELGLLSRGFNSLTEKIVTLIAQVKDEQRLKTSAEMRVLQAQIKPHFLFNTLESINVLAIQNEGRKVSQMVYRLGNILRISIQDKEEISLKQELEYLRSYLEIQKFRFEDLFDFEIDVPEEMLRYTVQKLTLQPLVENCIQHAFDGITWTGMIRISASYDDERICLFVADNGKGMSNEQLQRFVYLESPEIAAIHGHSGETYNLERRGLGVRSVADRIRIQYGERYGIFICSELNNGTIIKCTIPRYE